MSRWSVGATALAGLACTIVVSTLTETRWPEAWKLALSSGTGALATGLVGGGGLFVLRNRSIGAQAVVVAVTSLAAVTGGAFAASQAMYVSRHDMQALLVVLTASATVGIVAALILGQRVGRASRDLEAAARRIATGDHPADIPSPPTGEMGALASELDAMADQLEKARARERALEASRRELVAWVSHDLRTPLAAIRAVAEALDDGVVNDSETVARYHRTLREEADTLASLVDDLFELSRIQAGALRLHLERSSIGDLISDALAAAEPLARGRSVCLEGHLAKPIPELVLSVPEISRVLRNLLANAIRHSCAEGVVRVEAGSDREHVYVSVADACGGIPEADIERIFLAGFRGEAARYPRQDGAGLGLTIARGLVEAHRGDIAVVNENGGCRFTIRLPISA